MKLDSILFFSQLALELPCLFWANKQAPATHPINQGISVAIKATSGKLLHQRQTPTHTIEVRENRKFRWMHFGGPSVQSAMSLSEPSVLTLPYMQPMVDGMLAFMPKPKSALILGLGGGSLVRYFHHHLPHMQQTVIEIDQDVIELAQEYFAIPETKKINLIHADCADYLATTEQQFDVIISDIYSNEELPGILLSSQFHQKVYQCLNPEGVFIANIICDDTEEFLDVMDTLREPFHHHTLCLSIPYYRNIIVFALNDENFHPRIYKMMENGLLQKPKFDMEFGLFAKKISPASLD